jgi:hypothetical protein
MTRARVQDALAGLAAVGATTTEAPAIAAAPGATATT